MRYYIVLSLIILLYSCQKEKPREIASQQETEQQQTTIPVINNDTTKVGLEIGNRAPELSLIDTLGNSISLKSLRGKIVLIDFWASWCKPCRVENAKILPLYKQYNDTIFKNAKGFEVYSINVDAKREYWISYVIKDGYNWTYNVFDADGQARSAYQLTFLPMNYLVNGEGIIIAGNLRGEAVEQAIKMLF